MWKFLGMKWQIYLPSLHCSMKILTCPLSSLFQRIPKALSSQWQDQWTAGNTDRHMHSISPKILDHITLRRLNRREEVILTRLRFGHCGLNSKKKHSG